MAKYKGRETHVFSAVFDELCRFFGPVRDGGNERVGKILGRRDRTIRMWRSGEQACPVWAYELLRLTYAEHRKRIDDMFGYYHANRKMQFCKGTSLSIILADLYGNRSANDEFSVSDIAPSELAAE